MPQLDKLSFSTQYIWLTIFFWIFYFLLLNIFFEKIFKAIKLKFLVKRYWNNFIYCFNLNNYLIFLLNFFQIMYFPFLYHAKKIRSLLILFSYKNNIHHKELVKLKKKLDKNWFYLIKIDSKKTKLSFFRIIRKSQFIQNLFFNCKIAFKYLILNLIIKTKKSLSNFNFLNKNFYFDKNWTVSNNFFLINSKFIWDLLFFSRIRFFKQDEQISRKWVICSFKGHKYLKCQTRRVEYDPVSYWIDQVLIILRNYCKIKTLKLKQQFICNENILGNYNYNNINKLCDNNFLDFWILTNNFLNLISKENLYNYNYYNFNMKIMSILNIWNNIKNKKNEENLKVVTSNNFNSEEKNEEKIIISSNCNDKNSKGDEKSVVVSDQKQKIDLRAKKEQEFEKIFDSFDEIWIDGWWRVK